MSAIGRLVQRQRAGPGESRWPASLAVAVAIVLYVILPDPLIVGPRWVLPALEAALLVPLTITSPRRHSAESDAARMTSLGLIALVNLANLATLVLLVHFLLAGKSTSGHSLVLSSIAIWMTNVIVFGLWYWELDRGGPAERDRDTERPPGFLFPQMSIREGWARAWKPGFVDYLYVSLTNATAFSPTDTMPLTRWVKGLMGMQAMASLITVALVAARAVNILGS